MKGQDHSLTHSFIQGSKNNPLAPSPSVYIFKSAPVSCGYECYVSLKCFCNSRRRKPAVRIGIFLYFFYAQQDNQQNSSWFSTTPHTSTCRSTGRRQQLRHPGAMENRLIDTMCILDLLLELLHSFLLTFYPILLAFTIFLLSCSALFLCPFQETKSVRIICKHRHTQRTALLGLNLKHQW